MQLPSIRQLFQPDPGYIMLDVDLDRADLQVVVWEADDDDLKRQLRLGVDLHIMNGCLLSGVEPPPEDELIEGHPEYPEHKKRYKGPRQLAKNFVHGTNYGGSPRTMARVCGITVRQAELLQRRWFAAHPGIHEWHRRTESQLYSTRSVRNAFGYRRFYFDRIEGLLPEALAWVPQSTVAIIINKGWDNIEDDPELREVQVLLQVHDSLVMQVPVHRAHILLPKIRDALLVTVPYPDPLIIPVGVAMSQNSWGECSGGSWEPECLEA